MKYLVTQYRQTLVGIAMILVFTRVALDGLAAIKVLPSLSQDYASDLMLLALLALALPKRSRQSASRNWVARYPVWATVVCFCLVFGAVWADIIIQHVWRTPLAARLIPDLLGLVGFGFWINNLVHRNDPLSSV